MTRLILSIWLTVAALLPWHSGAASTYSQFLDSGGWRADSSVFACELSHAVPFYGAAVFATRAGEASQFHLASADRRLASGEATLAARSPVWLEQSRLISLRKVNFSDRLRQVVLPSSATERMLKELYSGRELVFKPDARPGDEGIGEVAITTVGFRAVYQQYLSCLSGLLPANFDQIKRTAVYFGSGQFEDMKPSELRKLDHIIAYVKADASVKEFYIDGHTDSVGTREDNLELARQRAEEVTRYLVNQGVPEGAIISRWHGERYPVASNETVADRAKNRRVTIRLEKIQPPG